MESGTVSAYPLLSITIPTWNRAQTLAKALSLLLPQVEKYSNEIEVVLSDNASDDNTSEIVQNYIKNYPGINIASNRNNENIKFFGNFVKCRELAQGKYIWILSDDDFVCPKVVSNIINAIKNNKDIAAIYLKNEIGSDAFDQIVLHKEEFIKKETNAMSLISKCIFLNNKNNDKDLIARYQNNAFMGFIFLLNSFQCYEKVLIIKGESLQTGKDRPKGYNYFDVFINHMQEVIDYMNTIAIPKSLILYYRNKYLLGFLLPIYLVFRAERHLNFGDFKKEEILPIKIINMMIRKNYNNLWRYWLIFYPFTLFPAYFLSSLLYFRRFLRFKLKKYSIYGLNIYNSRLHIYL
jgi:glycosyltransferase involved in cell wall biosynthesis